MNEEHAEPTNTPDSSPNSSDSESPTSESDNILPSEPDVSLNEMLSLACRQGKLDIVQLLLQNGAHVNHRNKAGNTPLLEACSQGHVAVANYLLEHGSKIDAPTETTLDSALTWACTLGNTNIVDALLCKKADVEHRTKDGCTALMFACLAGHRDVTEKLLDASSEINVESDSNKDSPLTFACWKGHFDVVELLLSRKANIEHRTKEGFSPLMFAALGGHTKVARKLLECNAQVNVPSGSNNDIPLTSACWKGHHDVVGLLLEFNSNIEHRTKDGCTPLMLAAREGHIHVAELLLKNEAQVNVPSGSENNIPLTLACWKGHWEVVKLLLEYGSDIEHRNKAGCTPLMLAAREGHYETTALLLERNAQVNVPSGSNDDTPLTLACWKGHKEVVLLLLESKSNIDHQTKTGCTPLMEATREGHRDVADILLNHNADVELPDNYGQSPLFMACWKGHRSVAELLLQRSAYRDCRTKTGITPLFQACRENHVSIVELLLEHGAGVNNPFPNSRENPMTLCAEKGHKELVQLLLEKGARHDCRTKKGCTPEFLACKEGHIEIAKMLAEQGANIETSDCRGNTPIMAAYKNGHVSIVDWLINLVHHLPSQELCHKILMSSVDEKDKELIVQRRSKCLAIIQEMKKKRELLALRNAQNLVQELDDERNREEKKKKQRAAKRRDKQNKRKKNREIETVEVGTKINGILPDNDDEDDNDDEEIKDNIVPTENREKVVEDELMSNLNLLHISSSLRSSTAKTDLSSKEMDLKNAMNSRKKSRKKSDKNKPTIDDDDECTVHSSRAKNAEMSQRRNKNKSKDAYCSSEQNTKTTPTQTVAETTATVAIQGPPALNKKQKLCDNNVLEPSKSNSVNCNVEINRKSHKTSGACTQSSSTSGPSRAKDNNTRNSNKPNPSVASRVNHTTSLTVISSVAVATFTQITTTKSDPRSHRINMTPVEPVEDWDEEANDATCDKTVYSRSDSHSATSNSSVSRNGSFDEYKESDWRETSKTARLILFELVVPNGFCGRVIGKGGKKINMITEDSGAQITIDKPPSNVIPADRVITIKGTPTCAERARHLVTKALNTPSLNNQGISVEPMSTNGNKVPNVSSVCSTAQTVVKSVSKPSCPVNVNAETRQPRLSTGRPIGVDVIVTPQLSYSKVATGDISLQDLKKRKEPQTQVMTGNNATSHNSQDTQFTGNVNKKSSPPSKDHVPSSSHATSLQSDGFATKDFSYFTTQGNRPHLNEEKTQTPLQSISAFVETKQGLCQENFPWKVAEADGGDALLFDRSRSISWTGQSKLDAFSNGAGPGNRSLSTEAINDRQGAVVSPWNPISKHGHSTDELSDEQVFTEEVGWSSKAKIDSAVSTGNEVWELSSSPTSSVSSSKVELTNILDNDSGMSSSNPLGPTPPSVQSESRISLQEQQYLETTMDNSTWLQSRGAYSAPSSPALQRSNGNHPGVCSPKQQSMRSHPSMEELNSSPWKKNIYSETQCWNEKSVVALNDRHDKSEAGADTHDSGLSSPHGYSDRHLKHPDTDPIPGVGTTPWSAERFQDVHTALHLLRHLSLDKYAAKLEEHGISLESLLTLTEKDLQTFGIPKGPRLKILKACDVIKNQRFNTYGQSNSDLSAQTFFATLPNNVQQPAQQSLPPEGTSTFNNKHQQVFSAQYGYPPDFLPYPGVPQQPYNMLIPSNQPFIHPSTHQNHPGQPAVFTNGGEFALPHHSVEQLQHHNQTMIPPTYVYQENPFYFYPPPPQS